MNELKIAANGKINLGLRVKFKRQDGFHEIESIFQEIDFADYLVLKKAGKISFATNSTELINAKANLCIKAAELLQLNYNIPGIDIFLDKRIPIGSGLGGGSSDAAAILKSINLLFKKNISAKDLKQMAAKIGSDVPFFIDGKTHHISGRGEIISPVAVSTEYYIILVFPGIKISTAEAYKSLGIHLTKKEYDFKFKSSNLLDLSVRDFKDIFFNDFEKIVFERYPKLLEIKNLLYQVNAEYAGLSGSGSTIYGIYSSLDKVNDAYGKIKNKHDCLIAKPVH